jgi:acetoin utilization protein AcuB
MLVKDVMDHHPVTVTPDTPVAEVRQLMRERHTSSIPVVENRKLLKGLATRHSLMINPDMVGSHDIITLSQLVAELKIKKAMIKGPDLITIHSDQTIEEASKMMLDEAVGCLPVVEEKVLLVGLITRDDLLAQLTEMMSLDMHSVRVTVRMPMVKGETAKLVNALSKAGLGLFASGTSRERTDEGYCRMVIKIRDTSLQNVKGIISSIPNQQIIDIREM